MKQSLIFTIIISLLILTFQTVNPILPRAPIDKRKCPCGLGPDRYGGCTVRIPWIKRYS